MKNHLLRNVVGASLLALAATCGAQTVTNPCPNRVISWNLDDYSTVNPTDLAGLAPATNWVDTWLNNVTTSLPDNTGTATTMNLSYSSYNTYQVESSHPGYDANGTANREVLNGFLNAGPAAWSPWTTNTSVSMTNIPYAKYDVIVYLNSDTSGRHSTIDNGSITYYFSTVGSASLNGANALFLPTTAANGTNFATADFAFFPAMTTNAAKFTTTPKSGNDQWLGIAGVQIIECSNTYVVYGPSPSSQIVPTGQPAKFSVLAGGLNPTYQWRHAGTNLLNATNAAFSIAATAAGQDGNYDVIVANSFNSVTSVVATLTFYTPKTAEWDGNGSTWDTNSLYWTLNGGSTTTNYTETDNVRFGPLGAGSATVSLGGTFTPSSITVSNASYMLTSGGLAGSGSMRLKSNATLILDTPDTSTGPTLIDSGSTLQLDNGDTAGSLGSGPLTNNGALLFNANGSEAYGYPIYGSGSITNEGGSGTITLGNNVNASYLVQAGGSTLLLQGSNSLSGGLVISGGTVWARAVNCLGMAPITVSGGQLQLSFSLDFPGSTLTLAGGLLYGGNGGSCIYEGQVILSADSSIEADSGNSFTLANAAGLNGGSFNLTQVGSGTVILAGATNTWGSVSINGTLQVGNGGANASVGPGTISDSGILAFNSTANLVITNPISGSGGINQLGSGSITFADLSALGGLTTISAGTLFGTFTNGGSLSILPGATLAPGTPATIGTLTINGGLTLGGNLTMKINRSLVQSNDMVAVPGGVNNTNNGIITVKNLGPALAAGNQFYLFSQAVTGGDTLSILGGGVIWSNNLVNDGSIIVLATSVPQPVIRNISATAGSFVFSGTNGYPGAPFAVLTATNLASNWTIAATGSFDNKGAFSVTNAISSAAPQVYYRLEQ
jgi:hypothetical protein